MKNILGKVKNVHMVGIKGTGMSALAVNLKHMGIRVIGSDYAESFFTDELLKKQELKALSPFSADNIPKDTDLVVVSTAYGNKNPELREAKRRGLRTITYPEALGLITQGLPSVAICGSHGKTTTSAALGYILSKTKYNPIINVGSIVPQLLSYKARDPKLFVFEADEYQDKFRFFYPKIVILTNIDYDHPDYFRNPAHYKTVFRKFIGRIPTHGLLIYCADNKNCRDVTRFAKCKKISYGFSKNANHRIEKIKFFRDNMVFNLRTIQAFKEPGESMSEGSASKNRFKAKLFGKHNALNLAAAALCAAALGVSTAKIKKSIADFAGAKRRLEVTGRLRINGQECIIVDDFGHHPTEIKATISALKAAYPSKILWTIFQPHTFSRTEALLEDFARCFDESDKTIILDIYASKRETSGSIHSRDLVKKIGRNAYYRPNIHKAALFLKKQVKTPSVILTLGASEVWRLAKIL